MDTDLKALSEFGAEWLGCVLTPEDESNHEAWDITALKNFSYLINEEFLLPKEFEQHLFESDTSAPILAHLAKRKMEEKGCVNFVIEKKDDKYNASVKIGLDYAVWAFKGDDEWADTEYIALWLAIRSIIDD